ncbi:MAG TPA: DUF3887 domain-containing protein [Terriglobia bacterium]|nr:DUF3887 domain-containing protein [Terriglobia bacterium]
MRRRCRVFVVVICSWPLIAYGQGSASRQDLARQVMTALAAGKDAEVISHFSPELQSHLTEAQMQTAWSSITQRVGTFSKILKVVAEDVQGRPAVFVVSQFTHANATLTLFFDPQDEIQGIWITPNSTLTAQQMESAARALVDQLSSGDYADVEQKFDSRMKSGLPVDKLTAVWNQALDRLGKFSQILVAQKIGVIDTVDVRCSFAKRNAVLRVSFDADNNVGGLWILPEQ